MILPNKLKLTKRVLYNVAKPITFESPAKLMKLSTDMHKFMLEENGIGLAAPQVGISRRVFVMQIEDFTRTYFNPEIINSSEEIISYDERCLSFPGEEIKLTRPKDITVKYQNIHGEYLTEDLTDLCSICFQHELDHLNGITMHDRENNEQ